MYGKIALGVLALGAVVLMGIPVADQNMYWYEMQYSSEYVPTSIAYNVAQKRSLWTYSAQMEGQTNKGPLFGNSEKSFCSDDAVDNTGGKCCDHFRETQVSNLGLQIKMININKYFPGPFYYSNGTCFVITWCICIVLSYRQKKSIHNFTDSRSPVVYFWINDHYYHAGESLRSLLWWYCNRFGDSQ